MESDGHAETLHERDTGLHLVCAFDGISLQ